MGTMLRHSDFDNDQSGTKKLHHFIRKRNIVLGGNMHLKIYGLLQCKSGKRMKRKNRVFFYSEAEVINAGYRPCAHCMRTKYNEWKNDNNSDKTLLSKV